MSKKKRKPTDKKKCLAFEVFSDATKLPRTNFANLGKLLSQGNARAVCEQLMTTLHFFQQNNYRQMDQPAVRLVNDFVSAVFSLMAREDFVIPADLVKPLASHAHLFSNLVTISAYRSADPVIRTVMMQHGNFAKLLFLYTARSELKIPQEDLFDLNPTLASTWFYMYPLPQIGCVLRHHQINLQDHYEKADERFAPDSLRVASPYFMSTYHAGHVRADRVVKERINAHCKSKLSGIKITNTPCRNNMLVVTSKWFNNSAVYKSCSPFIAKLRSRYHVTLAHTGTIPPSQLAEDYFDEIVRVECKPGASAIETLAQSPLLNNSFQWVYYPDIGMSDESVWMSNLRLAPIQITGHGHPVSTFGSEIDYFVVGAETEKLEDLDKNYSECPIVLPGLGAHPVWPTYVRKNLKRPPSDSKTPPKVIANCVWGPEKYNHSLLSMLTSIAVASGGKFQAEIFASRGVNRYNAFIPFREELMGRIGGFSVLHSDKEYLDYMEQAEYGDFAINSWPFGGYNTVVEALYLGKPVVTLEGDRFYNLAASALLRKVGLDELITTNASEFVAKCVQLVTDPHYLDAMKKQLESVDLKSALFNSDEPAQFERAVEYVIDNHEQLKGRREPIYSDNLT